MTTIFGNTAPQPVKQNGISKPNTAHITVQHDDQGLHYKHPQKGRVKVISLFCDSWATRCLGNHTNFPW